MNNLETVDVEIELFLGFDSGFADKPARMDTDHESIATEPIGIPSNVLVTSQYVKDCDVNNRESGGSAFDCSLIEKSSEDHYKTHGMYALQYIRKIIFV